MPDEVAPQKFPFASAATWEKFLKADLAARELAGDDWPVQPGGVYRYQSWNSGSGGYREVYAGTWSGAHDPHAKRPHHSVVLSTELYHQPRQAYGFNLTATRRPEAGWDVSLTFHTYDGPNGFSESFSLTFSHPEFHSQGQPGTRDAALVLSPAQVDFGTERRDDPFSYEAAVSSRSASRILSAAANWFKRIPRTCTRPRSPPSHSCPTWCAPLGTSKRSALAHSPALPCRNSRTRESAARRTAATFAP
jgi:hypothetical protein